MVTSTPPLHTLSIFVALARRLFGSTVHVEWSLAHHLNPLFQIMWQEHTHSLRYGSCGTGKEHRTFRSSLVILRISKTHCERRRSPRRVFQRSHSETPCNARQFSPLPNIFALATYDVVSDPLLDPFLQNRSHHRNTFLQNCKHTCRSTSSS